MSQKLALWNNVATTDTEHTKTSNQGGRQQTSIDGYWMIRKATEMFGPVGIGWGWDVVEERWDDGALISIKTDNNEVRYEQSKTHTIKLKLWYMHDGNKGEITQYGHTQAVYKSKWGASDDGEAPKKSLMDAIKKSLSMLGMCSDVFMGMFDDREYVAQIEAEQSIAKAEDKDAEIAAKRDEIVSYIERHIETIKTSTTAREINGIAKTAIVHLTRQQNIREIADLCERGIKAISRESENKKLEVSQ